MKYGEHKGLDPVNGYSTCPLSCHVCYTSQGMAKPGSEAKKMDNFLIQSEHAAKSPLKDIDFAQVEKKLVALASSPEAYKEWKALYDVYTEKLPPAKKLRLPDAWKEMYGSALPPKKTKKFQPCPCNSCIAFKAEERPVVLKDGLNYDELFESLPWNE